MMKGVAVSFCPKRWQNKNGTCTCPALGKIGFDTFLIHMSSLKQNY